jgi:DNA helicase II / ATP-dependent DNA helicase PcrA
VFLPGWEEGLFPHQRALDESGRAGLEEERRLAYVGSPRAPAREYIYFASNRRIHGLWQTTIPSRFLDELPEAHVEVDAHADDAGASFDDSADDATASPPPRAGEGQGGGGYRARAPQRRRIPLTIEGELVAKSTGTASAFGIGDRVFHIKFGNGNVVAVDGNKLTIQFDKAGEKRVVDSFVERV